jgi:glycosyltransferase involved in cell wall biosynthesis
MSEKFSANFSDRIRLFFYSYYMTKWMSHNLFLTSTSQLWADYLSSITGVKGYELRNGFDAELFNSIDATLDQNEFVITSMGAIHAQQDLSIFYKGLHLFIKGLNKSDLKIKVNFIGISTYYRPELINELNDNIPIDLIHVSGRIPHVEAIKVMNLDIILNLEKIYALTYKKHMPNGLNLVM